MRHRSARPRPSRRAISPVLVPGGRRRSRIPIPAAIALISALLAGLAVVLAPSAPQAGAQAAASTQDATDGQTAPTQAVTDFPIGGEWSGWPWNSVTFEGSNAYLPNYCGRTHAFRNVQKVGVNHYTGEIAVEVLGSCPPETISWEPVDLKIRPSGTELDATTSRSVSTFIRHVPVLIDPLVVGGALLIPGDESGSGSGSGSGEQPARADTSGLFGPDGELLRPEDFPPLDPVEVTGRALEANPSALESCMAGASDYIASIREQGVDLVKQMRRTELQLLSPQDATGPAVADVIAFLKNPFDYQSAAADPARWLCGQLVGLATDLGIGKLARGVGRTAPEFGELVPDLIETAPGSGGRVVATIAGGFSANTGMPLMADPPRGFRADGTLPRDTTLPLLDQGKQPICGVVSCIMVLQGAGKQIDARAILQKAKGFDTLSRLATILSMNGIISMPDRGPLQTLVAQKASSPDPFIAVVNVQGSPAGEFPNGGGAHAVVVDDFTTRYGQEVVAVRNPWGQQYFQLLSEFEKQFAGSWIRPL